MANTCKQFQSCEEAIALFRAGSTKLDRDNDGMPCESFRGPN
ncbi:excalibur calcium-binding domain-containing protein [Cyanobium sp. PCC 7001]